MYTEIVPDCSRVTLQAIIRDKIDSQSEIYCDGWRGYNELVDIGYDNITRLAKSLLKI